MKYELASSSAEEGEIQESIIPYYKSHLQYYYYPHTSTYIGKNSVPLYMNYKSEGVSAKLKKELKADYPYIAFNLLERGRAFFENKFKYIMDCPICENPVELYETKHDYKEFKKPDKKVIVENRFDAFFQKFFFQKEKFLNSVNNDQRKIIFLEDKMLEAFDNQNAFIFFRVATSRFSSGNPIDIENGTAIDSDPITKYAFEEIFFSKSSFYEYLNISKDEIFKALGGEEVKTYKAHNSIIMVYSSTVCKQRNAIRRIYSGIDCTKNTDVIFNKEGPDLFDIEGRPSSNIKYIQNLDLPDSDYVINDKKIYKISTEGIDFEFQDILYDDFIKSRWSNL